MSIRPIAFDKDTQTYTMLHDDLGYDHEFPLVLGDPKMHYGLAFDGSSDYSIVVTECDYPNCDSASYHPVSGGAAPREIQLLAVRLAILKRGLNAILAIQDVRDRTMILDGEFRWQWTDSDLQSQL